MEEQLGTCELRATPHVQDRECVAWSAVTKSAKEAFSVDLTTIPVSDGDPHNPIIYKFSDSTFDLEHIAFSFVHSGFEPDAQGGCSCENCTWLRERVQQIRTQEGEEFYQERYGKKVDEPR